MRRGKSMQPARWTPIRSRSCGKDAGVAFVEDPAKYGSLWVATLKDPEDDRLQLLQFDGAS